MSTHRYSFMIKNNISLNFVFWGCWKNFMGAQKRVRICCGKQVIEVRLYICNFLFIFITQ